MTTALAERPTSAATPPRSTAVLRRIAEMRRTSPGRLRLMLAVLLVLAALTGTVAGLTARAAATGTADLGGRAQPLLTEAETIYSRLADADTTAAQAFLSGGQEPVVLTARYEEDLSVAATALTSAARRTPEKGPAADAIRALSAGLARYNALVATARADNRQGLPVGASYLATASELNRETLQPQAQVLFQIAEQEVDAGYDDARSSWWLSLLLALLLILVTALLWVQGRLSSATRRTFNVPLVAATAVTVVLALAAGVVFATQRDALDDADRNGSTPVTTLAELRIMALRERAAEALTLAGRAGSGADEERFTAISDQLVFDDPSLDGLEAYTDEARSQHEAYVALHEKVRELDDTGRYDEAVALALGTETTGAFEALTGTLDQALTERKAVFDDDIHRAGRGLGVLTVLGPLLALLICLLVGAGIRARLEEYR
ncbi:hypothetical protein [Actinoplanes rectilineatus]|uniref:hypothetical protein n=1 Tax=Actinoplanes rectilineatus TaxID=113571 RepID=UPI0005F27FF2|nr:hypothetical protein [Actinoplanes rectilineatus]